MTVWVYVDSRKDVGDADYLKIIGSGSMPPKASPSNIRFKAHDRYPARYWLRR